MLRLVPPAAARHKFTIGTSRLMKHPTAPHLPGLKTHGVLKPLIPRISLNSLCALVLMRALADAALSTDGSGRVPQGIPLRHSIGMTMLRYALTVFPTRGGCFRLVLINGGPGVGGDPGHAQSQHSAGRTREP